MKILQSFCCGKGQNWDFLVSKLGIFSTKAEIG